MRAEDQAEGDLPDAANVKENGMGQERKWDDNESRRGGTLDSEFERDATDSGKKRHVSKSKIEIERPDGDGGYESDDKIDEVEEGEVDGARRRRRRRNHPSNPGSSPSQPYP